MKRITIEVPIDSDEGEEVVYAKKVVEDPIKKPKKQCTEKQLAALQAGRAKRTAQANAKKNAKENSQTMIALESCP